MKFSTIVLTIVCLMASTAWAISEPKCMLNESQAVQAGADAAAQAKPTEILEDPFEKNDDDDFDLLTFSWDDDLQEAVTRMTWPFKYLSAKLKEGFARFQSNMAVLRELHRRRHQNIHARLRQIRKSMQGPEMIAPRKTRPRSVRWIPESTLRAQFDNNLTTPTLYNYNSLELDLVPWRDTFYFAEQYLLKPNASIVAAA